ncbi:universal stress protein [Streptomyces sp. NPDC014733]|uniref:universal stress protein n=1 Tax=Streptomyces sp. NPDC014733 TaxID=3364885 RepID=UPI0036FBF062
MTGATAAAGTVTVGLDGSPESLAAVVWAADEAEVRGARLRLVHAWTMLAPEQPEPSEPGTDAGTEPQAAEAAGPQSRQPAGASLRRIRPGRKPRAAEQNQWSHRIVDQARAAVQTRHPDLPVDEELVPGDPLEALSGAADRSDLLVLGSRNLGPVARYVLGDVALKLVTRVNVPTVLVRARQGTATEGRTGAVVVGVSLHEPCVAMMDFAFATAARRGVTLRAVHGRHLPAHAYNRGGGVEPYVVEQTAQDARKELAEALRPWRSRYPAVQVEERVDLESPAQALLDEAGRAGLLVVGRRHRRPRIPSRIGHLGQAALHHAPCPVAVVPHE